jgi:8-oxo-dGTP pyrophosphatase MutT (NUDIX family)
MTDIRPRVSVLIRNKDKFILIFRHNNNTDYYAIPGGGIEEGETSDEAAIREIREELGFTLKNLKLISEIKTDYRHDFNYLAETDETIFIVTGPEKKHLADQDNLFKPIWLDKNSFDIYLPIYPESARIMFADFLKSI